MPLISNRPGLRRPGRCSLVCIGLLVAAAISASASRAIAQTAAYTYTPAQIESAYNYSGITFSTPNGPVTADGSGQTIAIIVAGDDPNLTADLSTFDTQFGIAAPTSLNVYNQGGTNTTIAGQSAVTATSATGTAAIEELLDVEWTHALAPGAAIDVIEANTTSQFNYDSAESVALTLPVSVVSMAYGFLETSSETGGTDTYNVTPANHQGITFISGSGDHGTLTYPGTSPTVLSVGGTSLLLNASNKISSETVWNDSSGSSGGGTSLYESRPSYQNGIQSSSMRSAPDVAFDGDSNTGLYVYVDNAKGTAGGYFSVGGTSAGVPGWAALIAMADQGRVLNGEGTLDSSDLTSGNGTLSLLYDLAGTSNYNLAFNDITSGMNSNGVAAGVGYDDVTGLGSPNASFLVPYLAGDGVPEPATATLLLIAAPIALRRRRR